MIDGLNLITEDLAAAARIEKLPKEQQAAAWKELRAGKGHAEALFSWAAPTIVPSPCASRMSRAATVS